MLVKKLACGVKRRGRTCFDPRNRLDEQVRLRLVAETLIRPEQWLAIFLHCCPKQDRVVPGSAESKGLESA